MLTDGSNIVPKIKVSNKAEPIGRTLDITYPAIPLNAISKINAVTEFLLQETDEKYDFEESVELLKGLFED